MQAPCALEHTNLQGAGANTGTHRPPAVASAVHGRALLLLRAPGCHGGLVQLKQVVQLELRGGWFVSIRSESAHVTVTEHMQRTARHGIPSMAMLALGVPTSAVKENRPSSAGGK